MKSQSPDCSHSGRDTWKLRSCLRQQCIQGSHLTLTPRWKGRWNQCCPDLDRAQFLSVLSCISLPCWPDSGHLSLEGTWRGIWVECHIHPFLGHTVGRLWEPGVSVVPSSAVVAGRPPPVCRLCSSVRTPSELSGCPFRRPISVTQTQCVEVICFTVWFYLQSKIV